ncbi:hypothetical protein H4R19_004562 [Coemansia spiralis]|nr:hypothetical protein H4R19_004562 [Coemansia spiralis]
MQAHGRLSLAPLPSEVERARMDAWVEDDDEFSPGDYDLSGAYYELGPKSASAYHAASAGASDTAYGGVPRPERQSAAQQLPPEKQDDSKCRTPESRMSSTSTVVDGGTLDPEQCKQIFLSSARKLQWSSRRREMSTVVHIRNAMARASEQYAAASGGRVLDPCPEARRLAADFCAYGGATPVIAHQQRDGMMLPAATAPAAAIAAATESPAPRRAAEREVAHSGGQLPARIRSMDCLPLLLQMARQGPEMRGDSGEPVYDGAHWAGAGDLVSLDPGGRSRPRTAYRPYPRRRGSRRSSACLGSAFVLAEAVVAQP